TCPVCFANANVAGYIYEPDFELVRKMLQALRDERPVPCRIVQFSGGEPTIYPRFFDVLRMARDMGFSHSQVATNGIKFTDLAFAGRIAKHELESKRFTLSDFAHAVQQQTGIADPYQDWFPLSCVTPFSKLISALRGEETTTLSCHPHCSIGTYLFVDQNRKA